MPEILFQCLLAVLAVVGTVEIIRAVLLHALKTENPGRFLLAVSFSGHDERAEFVLRNAIERAKWVGGDVQVVCLDRGMDEETRRICETVCLDHPEVILCTPDEYREFWMG
ncbi:MAG: hypothetical protein LKJ21_08535 [Oscillospiraceae bacterium]|jgi:hypothetical protein|nr:hypothetical protein [Oscillospiraceae bacterium]MCI1990632.1 hypothetical protein [Oscillospiraceae bacterium]MCI2036343.1 hypothetical protein [Oscillospiraceae bacterium]